MFKVTRPVLRYTFRKREITIGEGKAVQVQAFIPKAYGDQTGGFVLSIMRRLTPDNVTGDRKIPQFAKTIREKGLLVTRMNLSPEEALMLWYALNEAVEDARIIEKP